MGINSNSKQDLEDFKSYIIAEKNFSQHTAKAYCSDILSFLVWMDDEWTVVTADHSLSAHYENTILITEGKPEILSLTEEEKEAGLLDLI